MSGNHSDDRIKNDDFIEKMGRYYVKRKFEQRTGVPFHEFLNRVVKGVWRIY